MTCKICGQPLNVSGREDTGDCLRCMADAGDADAQAAMYTVVKAELRTLYAFLLYTLDCQAATAESLPAHASKSTRRRHLKLCANAHDIMEGRAYVTGVDLLRYERPDSRDRVAQRLLTAVDNLRSDL